MGKSQAPASIADPVSREECTESQSRTSGTLLRVLHRGGEPMLLHTHKRHQKHMIDTQIPEKKKRKRNKNLTHPT